MNRAWSEPDKARCNVETSASLVELVKDDRFSVAKYFRSALRDAATCSAVVRREKSRDMPSLREVILFWNQSFRLLCAVSGESVL